MRIEIGHHNYIGIGIYFGKNYMQEKYLTIDLPFIYIGFYLYR